MITHKSNYGIFAARLIADLDGLVGTTADDMTKLRFEPALTPEQAEATATLNRYALDNTVSLVAEWRKTPWTEAEKSAEEAGVELLAKTERERDEARTEVERLSTWGPLKRLHTEMEAEVKAAYQRGAEAMREAAIRVCEEPQMGTEAEAIRALPVPVPEDKP